MLSGCTNIFFFQEAAGRNPSTNYMNLANWWGNSPEKVILGKDGMGICTKLHPSLSGTFRTNQCNLNCKELAHLVFSDKMFNSIRSQRNNKLVQVFATNFGWCQIFPIRSKDDAHEAHLVIFN